MIFSHPFPTKRLTLACLLGLLLAGCQAAAPALKASQTATAAPLPTGLSTPTGQPSATATRPPVSTPSISPTVTLTPTAPGPQRSRYSLVVDYDPRAYQTTVQEKITYFNPGSSALDDLVLVVDANRRAGQFKLKSLTLDGAQKQPVVKLDGMRLALPLETPLQPGQAAGIELDFELHLPNQAIPLGYTPHQANFVDWYPYLPPYSPGQGWVIEPAASVGEHLAYDLADFDVEIRLPDRVGQQVIAASAPSDTPGSRVQHFKLAGARNFNWSISSIYRLVTARAALAGGKPVAVSGYVFPEHEEAGKLAVSYVAEALTLFSSLFTPYQHGAFSFVEVDFADGMESDGMFFLNKAYFAYNNGAQSGLCALSVHETSHQWWYGQVGNNQALDPWMDESLATYSELIYYRKQRPELVDWWWSYRVAPFKPAGNVGATIYDFQSYRPYINAVYLRGVQFLDELHKQMGDEAFLAFLRNYATFYGGKQASRQDFFTLLHQSTNQNVQPLVDSYFAK